MHINIHNFNECKSKILNEIKSNMDYYEFEDLVFLSLNSVKYIDKYILKYNRLLPLFSKYNILNEEYDPYKAFCNIILENNLTNSSLCEIGYRMYPILSIYLLEEINIKHLNIYDIKPVFNSRLIIKEEFSKNTKIDDIDVILSLFQNKYNEEVLRKAIIENKKLFMGLKDKDEFNKIKFKYKKYIDFISWPDAIEQNFNLPKIIIKK